ncbi:MAG: hypothetical protein ACQEQC_03275 [Elusimicrobiota bacterium]
MKDATSKFIFALIIGAVLIGWIYTLFVPAHTLENNLELNANYYPGIRPETVEAGPVAKSTSSRIEKSTTSRIEESTDTYNNED